MLIFTPNRASKIASDGILGTITIIFIIWKKNIRKENSVVSFENFKISLLNYESAWG